jgi:hypothetical protein
VFSAKPALKVTEAVLEFWAVDAAASLWRLPHHAFKSTVFAVCEYGYINSSLRIEMEKPSANVLRTAFSYYRFYVLF